VEPLLEIIPKPIFVAISKAQQFHEHQVLLLYIAVYTTMPNTLHPKNTVPPHGDSLTVEGTLGAQSDLIYQKIDFCPSSAVCMLLRIS